MLTRTPDQDPPASRSLGRTFFEAFRGIDPNTVQLTRPVTGFDAKLNVVFVANPVFRDVILVDRTLPKDRLDALIQAAKAMVAEAKDNVRYAIVGLPIRHQRVGVGCHGCHHQRQAAAHAGARWPDARCEWRV